MITRREALRLGLLGGAAAILPLDRVFATGESAHGASRDLKLASPLAPSFAIELPIPPVLKPVESDATTDYYEIEMRASQKVIVPGLSTTIWGYNGQFPGPTIKAREGRRVVVRQTNHLDVDTVVHLHGGHIAPEHDGHPTDVIPPGASRDYIYPNSQPGATLWYHDHTLGVTGRNIYRGLAGFYLIEGADEAALRLPTGDFDVPLIFQDRLIGPDGALIYNFNSGGVIGDTILVNGAPQPRFDVVRRRYRLRLLNGSNYREYELALEPAMNFSQIASDGGLLPAAVKRASIRLAPAERVEVIVDFSSAAVGDQIVLRNKLSSNPASRLMRFDVVGSAPAEPPLPPILRRLPNLGRVATLRTFSLSLDGDTWRIGHKGFDKNRYDANPRLNTAEIWQFNNESDEMHPMHLHLVQFLILTKGGSGPPIYEIGAKDTVAVPPRESVRIMARFDGFTGPYVFHCHRLEHEDMDMMSQFRVVP